MYQAGTHRSVTKLWKRYFIKYAIPYNMLCYHGLTNKLVENKERNLVSCDNVDRQMLRVDQFLIIAIKYTNLPELNSLFPFVQVSSIN